MWTPKPRVMIVDDDPDATGVLLRALERHGYSDVRCIPTVPEALESLEKDPPDALLLDLSLSIMDGHHLLRHVRRNPGWTWLPVLLLVGRHPVEAIRAATQEGATAFIAQPFGGLELTYKIEQAVRTGETRDAELTDLRRPDPL
jgi:CheY-like chemotaxis protein